MLQLVCDKCHAVIQPGDHVTVEVTGLVRLMVRDPEDIVLWDSFLGELRHPPTQRLSLCERCAEGAS
jgi:hypothetical protein